MANTKVTQHVIANNAITADQIASAAVTDAKLHSTLDLSGKTLTLPATAIPSASTATTQAASDNSTKLATTAYVTTAIGNLVDSAPTALDTLNELAAALGDDANFSGTVTTSLASKLPLAGGTMTGALVLSGAPTSGLHAATKTYVDTADALKLNLTGGTLTGDLILNTTTALQIPVGTTGQRPTAAIGQIRWNSTDGAIEVYNGTAWTAVGTGSSNKVLDTFTGDGSTTTFTLSVTPANEDAIMVFIDGAYQEKSDYVLTNNSLVLDTAPLSAEKIAVHITTAAVHDGTSAVNNQFTATAGQTAFTLTQDPSSENNTQVYINGVYQQKTDYTVVGTTLTFDTGLTVGDVVEVNMFTVATLGNTDTVTEGVSNLYHTTARARGAISVSGNALSYNSSTGVITANFEESPTFTSTVTTPTLITGAYGASGSAGDGFRLNSTDLYGQVDASDKVRIAVAGASFFNGGNVGIGTVTPGRKLVVSGGSSLSGSIGIDGSATGNQQIAFLQGGTDKAYLTYWDSSDTLALTDGSANGLHFSPSTGKVGIGTDSPDYQLHVAGAGDIKIEDTGGGSAHLHIGASTGGLRNSEWRLKTSGSADEFYIDHTYTANDGSSDVAGSGTVLTLKSDANVDVTNDIVANNAKLKAIAESNTDTAVDVFVYDTRKDSDGGAWRKRTQNTSWYNEASGTNRSSRKEFPCVAVIVVESNEVTIYDGDDPDMPMWMRFTNPGAGSSYMVGENSNKCVAMLNGVLGVGSNPHDFYLVNFIKDKGYQYSNNVLISGTYKGNISTRNVSTVGWIFGTVPNIIHRTINDVAMTVLPNAPIDADTGLPVPTIALATGGGVSVIKDDGTVVDITSANGWNICGYITFDQEDYIIAHVGNATGQGLMFRYPIPSADRTVSAGDRTVMLGGGNIYNGETPHFGNNLGGLSKIAHDESGFAINSKNNGYNQLVKYWKNNNTDYTKSAVAYINTDYNTGWMPGDMRLSTLSATSTVDNTDYVGGEGTFSNASNWSTDSQWTVSGGTASYSGSGPAYVSRTPTSNFVYGNWYYAELDVTAGSAGTLLLVNRHISGIVKPYTGGLTNVDVGFIQLSGTKYFAMWQQNSNNQSSISVYATSAVTIDNFKVYEMPAHDRTHENNHFIKYGTINSAAVETGAELISYSTTGSIGNGNTDYLFQPYTADLDFGTGDFSTINWYRQDSSLSDWVQMYQRGAEQYLTLRTHPSSNSTYDGKILFKVGNSSWAITNYNTIGKGWICIVLTRSSGVTKMYVNGKHEYTTTSHNGTVNSGSGLSINPGGGKVALLRMTASALNEETIKKIYEDEKYLFATNAKATLYGSSDSATALAYDDDTELLHVGTSAGRSVFQGLNRVDNTTDAVTVAISASNELVAEE